MGKKDGIKKRITQRAGLAPEAVGCVRLTAIDNTHVCIENHGSISEYTPKRAGINAGCFYITVQGSGLVLESFGQENVSIKGEITSITYELSRQG